MFCFISSLFIYLYIYLFVCLLACLFVCLVVWLVGWLVVSFHLFAFFHFCMFVKYPNRSHSKHNHLQHIHNVSSWAIIKENKTEHNVKYVMKHHVSQIILIDTLYISVTWKFSLVKCCEIHMIYWGKTLNISGDIGQQQANQKIDNSEEFSSSMGSSICGTMTCLFGTLPRALCTTWNVHVSLNKDVDVFGAKNSVN